MTVGPPRQWKFPPSSPDWYLSLFRKQLAVTSDQCKNCELSLKIWKGLTLLNQQCGLNYTKAMEATASVPPPAWFPQNKSFVLLFFNIKWPWCKLALKWVPFKICNLNPADNFDYMYLKLKTFFKTTIFQFHGIDIIRKFWIKFYFFKQW